MGVFRGGGDEWFNETDSTCMNQEMLLQMGQLCKVLGAVGELALEGPLPRVGPQVHLQVAQLTKHFVTCLALVDHLPVLLLEGVGQRLMARDHTILDSLDNLK